MAIYTRVILKVLHYYLLLHVTIYKTFGIFSLQMYLNPNGLFFFSQNFLLKRRKSTQTGIPPPPGFEPRTCDMKGDPFPTTPRPLTMSGSVYIARHIPFDHFFFKKLSRRAEQGVFQVAFCSLRDC